MLVWIFAILFINVSKCKRVATPYSLVHVNQMHNLAQFNDAQHRGPFWYSYSEDSENIKTSMESSVSTDISESSYGMSSSEKTTDGSSEDTTEKKMSKRMYRVCTPCPHDMLKKFTNMGIKWICGGYQRARRTFKSDCMMRYRNCQDGTMFIKLHDSRCRRDSYHGKNFFYQYKV